MTTPPHKGGVFLWAAAFAGGRSCATEGGGHGEGLDAATGAAQRGVGHRARPGGVA